MWDYFRAYYKHTQKKKWNEIKQKRGLVQPIDCRSEMHPNNFMKMLVAEMEWEIENFRIMTEQKIDAGARASMHKGNENFQHNRNVMKRNAHSGLFIFVGNKHQLRSLAYTQPHSQSHVIRSYECILWIFVCASALVRIRCYFFIFHSIAFSSYFRVSWCYFLFRQSSSCSIAFLTCFFFSLFIFIFIFGWCGCHVLAFMCSLHRSHMFSPFSTHTHTLLFHYTAKPENNVENYVHVALK